MNVIIIFTPTSICGIIRSKMKTVFIIMAFVIFLILKTINRLSDIGKEKEPKEAPKTRKCQYSCSDIPIAATRCPHCTSELEAIEDKRPE